MIILKKSVTNFAVLGLFEGKLSTPGTAATDSESKQQQQQQH